MIMKLRIMVCVRRVARMGKLSNAHNWVGRFERKRQSRRHCSE